MLPSYMLGSRFSKDEIYTFFKKKNQQFIIRDTVVGSNKRKKKKREKRKGKRKRHNKTKANQEMLSWR